MPKLTKRLIESTAAQSKDILLWDNEIKGFICKITPTGKKAYFLYYRTKDGRQRKPKIGDHGVIICEQARSIAQQWLAEVTKGRDPSSEKSQLRTIPTIKELFQRYMQEHAPHKKPSSQERDKRLGEMYIIPYLGNLKVSSIKRDDIIKLHKIMQPINASGSDRGSVYFLDHEKPVFLIADSFEEFINNLKTADEIVWEKKTF